jgi:serine/threonine protein kinase
VEAERNTTVLTSTLRAGLGSWWYTAPEQWKAARSANHLSDIYSLGKILQELSSGEPPINSDMPAGPFRPIVERATANRPEQRFPSVAAFLAALELAVEGPKGKWETAEDVARRLLERVRLPQPDPDALDELLSWTQSLDEEDHDDMVALSRVLPWISAWSVGQLWSRDGGAFRRVFQRYSDLIAHNGFDFDYCDILADFSRRAVEETRDSGVLRAAAESLPQLGESHNRWHVRDVLTGVLQSVRDAEMAVAALDGLRQAPRAAVEWATTDFTLRSLHPVLRAGIAEHLSEIAS